MDCVQRGRSAIRSHPCCYVTTHPPQNVTCPPHAPAVPPTFPPPSSNHLSSLNSSASSPYTSLLLFIAYMGMLTTVPFLTGIACSNWPDEVTMGEERGMVSERLAWRSV